MTLGVSHPPGYPLFALLGRLFSLIQIGNPAMTLNFFSALLGALGACLLAANLWVLLVASDPKSRSSAQAPLLAACLAGALAFAFSKSYWSAALAAKGGIYVLQVDLELAFFYFLQLHFLDSGGSLKTGGARNPLAWLTFLFALGLVNHWPTQFLTLPALTTLALVKAGKGTRTPWKPTAKSLIQTLSFALLVLGLYLYLPLRANQFPALNFGAPLNWHRFLSCLLRVDYSKVETLASAAPAEFSALGAKALYLSDHFLGEFNGLYLFLAALGVWGLLKKSRERVVLFLLMLLLTTLVVNVFYLRVDPIEFWHLDDHTLTLNWVFGILGGVGAWETLAWLGARSFFKRQAMARLAACLLITAVFPVLLFLKHRELNDQRREFLFRGYGMEALKSMDRGAFYFAESDYDYFSILYLTEVEGKRPDVGLTLTTFWGKDYWGDLMRHQYGTRFAEPHPVYCCFPNGAFMEEVRKRGKEPPFSPIGTIIEINTSASIKDKRLALQPLEELWKKYLHFEYIKNLNPINGLLRELCAHPYLNMANYLSLQANWDKWDLYHSMALVLIYDRGWSAEISRKKAEGDLKQRKIELAAQSFLRASIDYRQAGMPQESQKMFEKALTLEPNLADSPLSILGLPK